jgi:hypothetical protein
VEVRRPRLRKTGVCAHVLLDGASRGLGGGVGEGRLRGGFKHAAGLERFAPCGDAGRARGRLSDDGVIERLAGKAQKWAAVGDVSGGSGGRRGGGD